MKLSEIEPEQVVTFTHVTHGKVTGIVHSVPYWQDGTVSIILDYKQPTAHEVWAKADDLQIANMEEELKRKLWRAETTYRETCRTITNLKGHLYRQGYDVQHAKLKLKEHRKNERAFRKRHGLTK